MATALKAVPATKDKPRRLMSKDKIKAATPLTHEDVPCDEWEEGGAFRVGPMDYDTHEMWELAIVGMRVADGINSDALRGVRRTVVGRCMIDESGKRLFASDDEAADILGKRDWRAVQRGFEAVLRLSKDTDVQVEDAIKNSESAPSTAPSTD